MSTLAPEKRSVVEKPSPLPKPRKIKPSHELVQAAEHFTRNTAGSAEDENSEASFPASPQPKLSMIELGRINPSPLNPEIGRAHV